ncbi:prepilin-type N-terminal cleavage/methylation domain-containing protein [Patescibacteria group bacterium]|nr:prepilin-type N-terminal cleavage/methylation domain-containing protein [Patescibacteria group bacterium]
MKEVKRKTSRLDLDSGFTLIELLIVIIIIGILAGILIAVIDPIRQQNRSRNAAIRSALQKVGYGLNSARSATGRMVCEDELLLEVNNLEVVGNSNTNSPLSTDNPIDTTIGIDVDFNFPSVLLPDTCVAYVGNETNHVYSMAADGTAQCHFKVVSGPLRGGRFAIIGKAWELNPDAVVDNNTWYVIHSEFGMYECNGATGIDPTDMTVDTDPYAGDANCSRVDIN